MTDKIIISFFDFSGIWSRPYRKAGYIVILVDSKLGIDLYDFNYKVIEKDRVHGILAAPPCIDFTKAGSCFWNKKDASGQTNKSVQIVNKTLEIIDYFNPVFWALENPPGRLDKLIPELKTKRLYSFHPYYFGAPYSKETILYGKFNPFFFLNIVKPISKNAKSQTSIDNYFIHHKNIVIPRHKRSEFRSITPIEFSEQFYIANP